MSVGTNPGPYKPPGAAGPVGGEPIKNWLIESILVTLFCGCWPIGLFAIINAAKVDNLVKAGDRAGAMQAAATAKKLVFVTAGVGGVMIVLGCVLGLLMGALGAVAENS